MDTGYLAQQVTTIIGKLHSLFDEIGVPSHERDSRESDLFSSLSETLHNHLRLVASEKNELVEEGQSIITTIQQMEESLDDVKNGQHRSRQEDLKVTYPLIESLKTLREKQRTVSRLHQERYEQVRKLIEALESYSSHLESSFVQIKLPPVSSDGSVPPTFDLSPSYINSVDNEFTRVYEEYNKRVSFVQQTAQEIINLWAELGTPQAQTESTVIKHWRDTPEQLGLHENDIASIKQRKERLLEEKRSREKRINQMRTEVETLWDRLGVQEHERKQFLASNRGCGLRNINDLEDELARLHELKKQNLGLFVEDARSKLQALWDELYFSEDEAVEFTPMFCDVYSDALLSAHEAEISRLEALKEQRLPTLQLIDRHRSLIKDREDLASSSQDASRLLAKGTKGEKRDPTRLLREEKMRKRIAKDLPKIEAEIIRTLEDWEDEYGRPFLVFGERYLDVIAEASAKKAPPRSKTPNGMGPPPKLSKTPVASAAPSRAQSQAPASTLRSKTPVPSSMMRPAPVSSSKPNGMLKSPSKIPARVPLGAHNGNSPERQQRPPPSMSQNENGNASGTMRKLGMAPPPKMRDLYNPPELATPMSGYAPSDVSRSGSVVRQTQPEDPYNDNYQQQQHFNRSQFSQSQYSQHQHLTAASRAGSATPLPYDHNNTYREHYAMPPPPRPNHHQQYEHHYAASTSSTAPSTILSSAASTSSRQISADSSNGGTVSGSENWESYASDDEEDGRDAYFAKLRNARNAGASGVVMKRGMDDGVMDGRDGRGAKILRGADACREGSWATDEA